MEEKVRDLFAKKKKPAINHADLVSFFSILELRSFSCSLLYFYTERARERFVMMFVETVMVVLIILLRIFS